MTAVVVLQARTSSTRLARKALLPLGGLPMVVLAAKRAANTGKKVIVATSQDPSDDALARVLDDHEIECFRGSLTNVLGRFTQALAGYPDNTPVFRLTADNVFPDGRLIDEIEKEFYRRRLEYLCCNGEHSGVPYGMSVEVTWLAHLREAERRASGQHDREHVTPYVIRTYGASYFEKYIALGSGTLRCTVDTQNDYLAMQSLLSGCEDPVCESALEWIEKLADSAAPSAQKVHREPALILGTAQLGVDYGINNSLGQPSVSTAKAIVRCAISSGVELLDTARGYGASETVIGSALTEGWSERVSIITKVPDYAGSTEAKTGMTAADFVEQSVRRSCSELGREFLDVVMLHRFSMLQGWGGACWNKLKGFVRQGGIGGLGVSVQTPEELIEAAMVPEVGYIQMPFNILDWRWDDAIKAVAQIRSERRLDIHIRSVFLQGLLLSDCRSHWKQANVPNFESVLAWLDREVVACNKSSRKELCLAYVRSMKWADGIVVGVESVDQLTEIVRLMSLPTLSPEDLSRIHQGRPVVENPALNPSLWRA